MQHNPEKLLATISEQIDQYVFSLFVFRDYIISFPYQKSFEFAIDPAMGGITCMHVGPTIHTVIAGTSRGFVVVYDLRYEIPVQMWRHYDRQPITTLYSQESPIIAGMNRRFEILVLNFLFIEGGKRMVH